MRKAAMLSIILLASPICSCAQLTNAQQRRSVAFLEAPGICTGTGFFISGDMILTASHVAKTVRMEVWIDGKRYYGTVAWRDKSIDQALLRVSGYACKSPLKLAAPALGERVWAYGYPPDLKFTATSGDVGFDRFWGSWTMPGKAQPGMSGGPVVNRRGKVVGVISRMGQWGVTMFEVVNGAHSENH